MKDPNKAEVWRTGKNQRIKEKGKINGKTE